MAETAGKVEIEVVPTHRFIARATEIVTGDLRRAVERRDGATLVLSGGSTPRALYRHFAEPATRASADAMPWARVDWLWGDERCVPRSDPRSNAGTALADLAPLGLQPGRVHPIDGELAPEQAAKQYERTIERERERSGGRLDLILLGVGEDGHTASLFPGDVATRVTDRIASAATAPAEPRLRVTLTYPGIFFSRRILFLLTGEGKAEIARKILVDDEGHDLPAARVSAGAPRVTWLLDEAAAAQL